MYLKTLLVRFYKSFNYDYLRKHHPNARQDPWEKIGEMWYPYVRVPIDAKVTTIVGANESGKSHLLTVIEKGLSGQGIEREDFCRYSQFFTVALGQMKWPDFGFEWTGLTDDERELIRSACNISKRVAFDRFYLFRTNRINLTVYLPTQSGFIAHDVREEFVENLITILPHVFRINATVALPESVPIKYLYSEVDTTSNSRFETLSRQERLGFFHTLDTIDPTWFTSPEVLSQSAPNVYSAMHSFFQRQNQSSKEDANRKQQQENNLAHDLMRKIAKVDPEALKDLSRALQLGSEGHANGIIQKINDALASSLNFPHWWVQDRDFALTVTSRDYDLVFTIRDRTGTHYSFSERSSGLRYFLSYYIQYLAHEPISQGSEILLMDEPDAYLSSQAQQDLLKIFGSFAEGDREKPPVQVIYVTHSPFLIDRNHAERIRVLEKGVGDEGTRVVRDAAKNHYEPLRSAFGSFVGETTFIGNCNLMVEGIADQILIAGAATHLRTKGASELETLDLNHITIVPTGSASHIPYMVYLARGRDIEQPAVIVLLDSDSSGDEAKKGLLRGGPKGKQLLKSDYILQIGDLSADLSNYTSHLLTNKLKEIEDLIPLAICVRAVKRYLTDVCNADEAVVDALNEQVLEAHLKDTGNTFDAIQAWVQALPEEGYHIEKVGFARNVVDVLQEITQAEGQNAAEQQALTAFETNMRSLFRRLRQMQRSAEREMSSDRVSQRISRAKNAFLRDYPDTAKREQALMLLEDVQVALDDSLESDEISLELQRLRREFQLDTDLTEPIRDYDLFKERLERVKYVGRIATQVTGL